MSSKWPMPRLHARQSSPRTLLVRWQWSTLIWPPFLGEGPIADAAPVVLRLQHRQVVLDCEVVLLLQVLPEGHSCTAPLADAVAFAVDPHVVSVERMPR